MARTCWGRRSNKRPGRSHPAGLRAKLVLVPLCVSYLEALLHCVKISSPMTHPQPNRGRSARLAMQRIETCGTPYQRGLQQGRAINAAARTWMDPCLEQLQKRYGVSSPQQLCNRLQPQIDGWRRQLEQLYPDGAAEGCGLAMGMTGIPGPQRQMAGLLSLDALHAILPACGSVEQALDYIRTLPLNAYGFSLLLADAQGSLALVEKTATGTAVIAGLPLAHTNHILDPDLAQQNPGQNEPINTNGQRRLATARALLTQGATPAQIIADRSAEGPICQRGEDGLHTDFAAVFNPVEGLVHLWAGYPDQVQLEAIRLADIFATN